MIEAVLALSIWAQASAERTPKTMTDAERMNDKIIASKAYDANARNLLSKQFSEAIDGYAPGTQPELLASWGEFIAVDGRPFIALQLALPGVAAPSDVMLFGRVNDDNGKLITTYNEKTGVEKSGDDRFVERALTLPLVKSTGTFGLARGGEILAMTRVSFDPEPVAQGVPAVSRLIVSSDVHVMSVAQGPRDPFAFGGTKVVPKPGGQFRRTDALWLFAELRHPALDASGVPHFTTKLTITPANIGGPPMPAEATPLKGMAGHYGIGNTIDIGKLKPGDYTVRVVFTDMLSKQAFTREAAIHIRD